MCLYLLGPMQPIDVQPETAFGQSFAQKLLAFFNDFWWHLGVVDIPATGFHSKETAALHHQ